MRLSGILVLSVMVVAMLTTGASAVMIDDFESYTTPGTDFGVGQALTTFGNNWVYPEKQWFTNYANASNYWKMGTKVLWIANANDYTATFSHSGLGASSSDSLTAGTLSFDVLSNDDQSGLKVRLFDNLTGTQAVEITLFDNAMWGNGTTAITRSTKYHIDITFDCVTDTYAVDGYQVTTPGEGLKASWSGNFTNAVDEIKDFTFRARTDTNSSMMFDNVAAVPEPATASLIILGGVCGLLRRKK